VRRPALAAGALAILALGYLGGLLATGELIFRFELGIPGGPGSTLARTAEYWAAAPSPRAPAATPPAVEVVSLPPVSVPTAVAMVRQEPLVVAPVKGAGPEVARDAATARQPTGCDHGDACGPMEHKPDK
jgi:hypothetical protein